MLNMAELGFSSAVVFKLYKPIATGDADSVMLCNYYKKIYRYIGLFVAVGCCTGSFPSYFVKVGLRTISISIFCMRLCLIRFLIGFCI